MRAFSYPRAVRAATMAAALWWTGPAAAAEWYKGDLHAHSNYSDGDSPVAEVVAGAERNGLDFFVITDHDSMMGGVPVHWFDAGYVSSTMVLLYGVEWTTRRGHANVWAASPFDFSALWQAHLTGDAEAALAAAHAQGALFSINHPRRMPWTYAVPADADCVEVWNGPMKINANFPATHVFWDDLLRAGRQITGVGGSDTHHLHRYQAPFTEYGHPTTWVYAESRTGQAILDGIRAGHVVISHRFDVPRLDFTADVDGDGSYETMVGDSVTASGGEVSFRVVPGAGRGGSGGVVELPMWLLGRLDGGRPGWATLLWLMLGSGSVGPGQRQLVVVVRDGRLFKGWLIGGTPDEIVFRDEPPAGQPSYYRVERYGETGMRLLNRLFYGKRTGLTNPIYFQP